MVAMPVLANGPAADTERTARSLDGAGALSVQDGDGPSYEGPNFENNTTVELILTATERFEELDVDSEAEASAVNDTVDAISAALQTYRDPRYADSRTTFDHLAEAQRGLADLAAAVDEDERAVVEEISRELYAASTVTSNLAVADASAMVMTRNDALRDAELRTEAMNELGSAQFALARANRTASDANATPDDRADAVEHLETGWVHAQRVLDAVETTTEPTLSLSQGQAFERNGTVHVSIRATLSDVRAHAYENATVTVDGDSTASNLSFVSEGWAGATGHGMTTVDLGSEPENATVTVTATAAHDDGRTVEETLEIRLTEDDVIRERPAPDEYREVDVSNESAGVTVEVSGDGLHETDVSIADETPATDDAYRAGPMVRIESQRDFDDATVEIPIDDEALEREGNLSIVTWDPTAEEPWTPIETEIDREAGVATAEVDHFSFFSVFWIDDWEDATSDTITLDGNETDGDVGNGSGIEKADFVFVLDESGSMSGSPISYAEDAAKRFVGALTDDERAGLVGYDSGASLDQSLTTDHDALNRSLGRLDADGGTDTEAGLRTGLDHLESAGWENRSDVMILLSDGNSNSDSYPRRVAEDAADAGVEISTIGLGNSIDEDELREIAAITGGDFHHVEREEDLPETFERVAENQTGVDLQDTNGDGIPDIVAEMDLSMPTGEPGVVGEPLNLDPIALDTSGDGIRDNETVDINYRVYEENNETKLTAQVTYAASHPNRTDTTGDGLPDREQLEGWEIEVVDDPYVAQDLEELVTDPDVSGDPADFFTSRNASANPLVDDTNGDGLADIEERELGTDPERLDTTGDGISDTDAFDDPEEDPTVFSTSPPEATLLDYDQWSELGSVELELGWPPVEVETPSWNFQYQVRIEDPAGVESYELERGGRTVGADDDVSGYQSITRTETLDSLTEGAFTALRGSDTTIETTDVYGNDGGERIHSQSSFYGDVIGKNVDPYTGGVLSGFTHSAAELPELVVTIGRALWDDPAAAGSNFIDLLGEIDRETLQRAVPMMIETTRDQQQLDNPHPEGSDEYEAYAQGWYEGYALHFLASTAYGGTITKGASESSTVAQRVGRVTDDVPPIRAGGSGLKTAQIAHRLAERGYDDLAAQFRTAGKEAQAVKRISDVDTRILDELSATQREQLTSYLAQSSADALQTINRLEVDSVQKLLGVTDDLPSSKVSDFISHPRNHRLVTDLDAGNLRHAVDDLPRAEQRALHRLAYEGDRLRHVDSDLGANDVARASRNGADLRNTQTIAKSPAQNGAIRWMETSDVQHAINRHVHGERIASRDQTTLFPAGQSVTSPAGSPTMPSRMPADDAALRAEIQDMAYETIRRSTYDDGSVVRSDKISRHGIDEMEANLAEGGRMQSAYPRKGPDVRKFEGGMWYEFDQSTGDFVEWNP